MVPNTPSNKQLPIILGLLLWPFVFIAQPVTIDTKPAKVSYYRLPDEPLDPSFTTYHPRLEMSFNQLGKAGMSESYILDTYLRLEGYKKSTGKGDVEITASVGDFVIWMESRETTRTKSKDKDGKEYTKIRYHMEVKYSMSMEIEVYDKTGRRIMDRNVLSNADTDRWSSPGENSMADLESYWRINRTSRLRQLHEDLLKKGLKMIYDEINKRFGYQPLSDNARFETIGKKKHALHDVFEKNMLIVIDAFSYMDADKNLNEVKKRMAPAMTFYADQSGKFKSSSKDDMRIRHICLYNQALAYYWTEEFEKSRQLTQEILNKDSKDKDAKRLLEDIDETQASLVRNNRSTRHQIVVGSKT